MKSFATATASLKRRLGPRVVFPDAASLETASYDSSKIPLVPSDTVAKMIALIPAP